MVDTTHDYDRRRFLKTIAVAGVLPLVPRLSGAEPKAVITKPIPSTGEPLPVIGLGTSRTFNVGRDPVKLNELRPVLQAFFDQGGTLIDSSPMYGTAEDVTGALLKRTKHSKIFSATKVWTDGKEAGIQQMEQSRKEWGVARFDLMQIHNLRDWQAHLPTLKDMKTQGKIRYIGVTTSHGRFHDELEALLKSERLDFLQLTYNIEDREAEKRLLPVAAERGVAVLVNRPFQRSGLFGKVKGKPLPDWAKEIDCESWGQFFLKFAVSHPQVTCAIPATSKLNHMLDNMAAGVGRLPDAALRQRMIDYVANL
ncbi:MAG: aldo/keto reductase [Pseudomonadota bacterium]